MREPLRTPLSGRGYLVSWRLAGRRVVVVGGGPVAEGKVTGLAESGADLVVVSPVLTDRLADLEAAGTFRWVPRRFRRRDGRGAALVIAATGDPGDNARVHRHARRAGALVNCVDDPDCCDVTVPAVVRRGPATVAVTTDGHSPAAARFLREELEQLLPAGTGQLVAEAAWARAELRRRGEYRYDYHAWRQRLFEPGWEAVTVGNGAAAVEELARRFVAGFAASSSPLRCGSVSLVGAGPGDPGLLTVRGAELVARADVVLYDRLVAPEVVASAPPAAVRIPVGKAPGRGPDQARIEELLVAHAGTGAHVVRLKGGDPYLFGRGAEEVAAVAGAGIPVEVVPGVSSALAVPEVAGIPLTRRGTSSSFAVISGHRAGGDDYAWPHLARAVDTIVVLMGAATVGPVAARLVGAGRPPTQPVAAVVAGTTDAQAVLRTDLATLAGGGLTVPAPAVLVIGEVARDASYPGASISALSAPSAPDGGSAPRSACTTAGGSRGRRWGG
ncbi:MAG: uroporphyrinogen-III C-methyltransferase [Acidimicrobiales bacterium]